MVEVYDSHGEKSGRTEVTHHRCATVPSVREYLKQYRCCFRERLNRRKEKDRFHLSYAGPRYNGCIHSAPSCDILPFLRVKCLVMLIRTIRNNFHFGLFGFIDF